MKASESEQFSSRPQPRTAAGNPFGNWIKINGFILGLFGVVLLAFIFPDPAARNGWLHPELLQNIGIALILFLQGMSMPLEKVKKGAGNWKLHVIIQAFTFLIFPLVGLGFGFVLQRIWSDEPSAVRDGFLYLCVLPSTISTSVVLTSVAAGVGLRPFIRSWVDANKKWVNRISNAVILFFVYSAFCDSVKERIWHQYGLLLTVQILLCVAVHFGTVSLLIYLASRLAKLNREDAIACYFCSVKKTLAMGIPLAILILGSRSDLSLILLPIMFYHPFQLFTNGILANHWAKERG
jgi:sodium/bile acid cotransporter 7